MRVLLDEMLPVDVADLLPRHEVISVGQAGFKGLANGELIRRAIDAGFQVLVTADRGLPMQQNISSSGLAVVLVPGSRMAELAPRANEMESAVSEAMPGTVVRLAPRPR